MTITTTTLLTLGALIIGGLLLLHIGIAFGKMLWGVTKALSKVVMLSVLIGAPIVGYNTLSVEDKEYINGLLEEHKASIKAIDLEREIESAPKAIIIEE